MHWAPPGIACSLHTLQTSKLTGDAHARVREVEAEGQAARAGGRRRRRHRMLHGVLLQGRLSSLHGLRHRRHHLVHPLLLLLLCRLHRDIRQCRRVLLRRRCRRRWHGRLGAAALLLLCARRGGSRSLGPRQAAPGGGPARLGGKGSGAHRLRGLHGCRRVCACNAMWARTRWATDGAHPSR